MKLKAVINGGKKREVTVKKGNATETIFTYQPESVIYEMAKKCRVKVISIK